MQITFLTKNTPENAKISVILGCAFHHIAKYMHNMGALEDG